MKSVTGKLRIDRIRSGMVQRCYNPKNQSYCNYGARGVTICEEWRHSTQAFYKWSIANGYADDLWIDRIDVNGQYSPFNCKWSTRVEQMNNKRSNIFVEINGETKTFRQWERETSIPSSTIQTRYYQGLRGEELIKPSDHGVTYVTVQGRTHSLVEWSKITGIPKRTLRSRYDAGDREERLVRPIQRNYAKAQDTTGGVDNE